jgi:hypothetical protein
MVHGLVLAAASRTTTHSIDRDRKMKKLPVFMLCFLVATAGCANSSKNIAASYTSPVQFQGYDCAQLGAEASRIQGRVTQLGGRLDRAASNDAWLTAAGVVVFWPVLFAVGGTKEQEAEYARLKGEYDAIGQAAVAKKCGVGGAATPPTT